MAGTTLGTAYVQIVPSAQGIKGSITNALSGEADAAGSATGTSLGSKVVSFAKKAIIAGAIGKVIKSSLNEGAALQQSYFGGLDTLYGEAADAARKYAREASAAGISMNNWSEQAVSFGAVLKKTYGTDAAGAAEAANRAIMAMADNSAKMGTDISSIQMAYQGFAKDNYTMLDNLKLGYGGTRTEMQRLLKDAASMTDIQEELGIAVDANDMSFSNVANAIQVVQKNLGIAGVAADEASETFSGSFNAMKAAAQNLLGSLAIGENVGPAMEQLATSVSTFFFNNFIPMIGTLVKSLPTAIAAFLRQGLPLLVSNISSLLSSLTSSVSSLANNLSGSTVQEWATTTLPKILKAGAEIIGQLAKALITNLPKIVAAVGRIGLAIVQGLGSALWSKISSAAASIRDRFMAPINQLREKVRAAINKVKSLFPFSIGKVMSNLKLPHFKISGKFSLNPPSTPKLSVSWYAKGGIIDGATVLGGIGMGEAGPEAILPLDPFWDKMDKIANSMQQSSGDITINVYATPNQNVREIALEVERVLAITQKQRQVAWQ